MSKTFALQLTQEETELVFNAIAQLPYIKVAGLIQNLQSQVQAQIAEANKVETPEAVTP